MKVLLSAARRIKTGTDTSLWICRACNAKHASTFPSKELSIASSLLRANGAARTRFAPSPTGYLHLGSLRTALFNYLIAKATGGQFLLRIEDTDQRRTVSDAEERLFQDLKWAGIEWDEGPQVGGPYGPYKQSERTAIYRKKAEELLHSGNAYRCFCTPERLQAQAEYKHGLGLPPDYDRTCASIPEHQSNERAAKGEAHVIRLLVPREYPVFNDLVYGKVRQRKELTTREIQSFEDPILLKSDGFPTYHLANVVDDHLMKITHVIRGSEWMSSTPKHLALYQAFGWEPPKFAHVGLLLGKDRQKLSKRLSSTNISQLREQGVFPEALTNFVALLGWSHNFGRDVMSMDDLIENASMKYTRGDTIVGFEKLWFLQKRHAARYASLPSDISPKSSEDLRKLAVKPIIKHLDLFPRDQLLYHRTRARWKDYIYDIVRADAQNYTNPSEFVIRNAYFFEAPKPEHLIATIHSFKLRNVPRGVTTDLSAAKILLFFDSFSDIPESDWNTDELKSWTKSIIEQASIGSINELKYVQKWTQELETVMKNAWGKLVHQYIRWAMVAGMPGPDSSETMRILGKEESIRRLDLARDVMINKAENEGFGSLDG